MEPARVTRSAAAKLGGRGGCCPLCALGARRSAAATAARQLTQQQEAAAASEAAAIQAEAEALAEAELEGYFATAAEKPGPVSYAPPASPPASQQQFEQLCHSLRSELAGATTTMKAALARPALRPEAPTNLLTVFAQEVAKTV